MGRRGVSLGGTAESLGSGQHGVEPVPRRQRLLKPSTAGFMVNFRVADVRAMVAQLRANGCEVDEKVSESEYGVFGWVMDPEGNRIELWQPPAGQ